jgi:hypothetical protein
MLGGLTNLNIDPELIAFTRKTFIPQTGKRIKEKGFTFARYIVGSPFPHSRVRYSTTAVNDGRQGFGIYNVLSFILEGKRYGHPETNIEHRVKGQAAALLSFLETAAQHKKKILEIVSNARQKLIAGNGEGRNLSHIRMDYFPDPKRKTLRLPIFDLYTWLHKEKDVERFEPLVKVIKSVEKPAAYIFSKEHDKFTRLLLRHGIRLQRTAETASFLLERYTILHVTEIDEEDKSAYNVDVRTVTGEKTMDKGSIVVFTRQRAGNLLPLVLEPQSSYGVMSLPMVETYGFSKFLKEGAEYPIYRLKNPPKIKLEIYPGENKNE